MWWREWLDAEGIDVLIHDQDGVVSRVQLLAAGWTDVRIRQRLRARRWQTVHPGVYATFTGDVGHYGRMLAGLLYAGAEAMWSHHTAAEQLGLIKSCTDRPVHVTVPLRRRVQPQQGLVVHRVKDSLARADSAVPPRSAPAHAVLDVVDVADSVDDAVAAVAEACQSGRVTVAAIAGVLCERRRLRYRRELGPILDSVAAGSHSLLEVRYHREVEQRHRLARGTRQRAIDGVFTDVAYEEYGVVVELDGRLHLDPGRRWRDMDRDNRAALRAETTLRYGWLDVTSRPCQVAAQVVTAQRRSGRADTAWQCGPQCPVVPP
jgi:very-short-patch-repair endonuclease